MILVLSPPMVGLKETVHLRRWYGEAIDTCRLYLPPCPTALPLQPGQNAFESG